MMMTATAAAVGAIGINPRRVYTWWVSEAADFFFFCIVGGGGKKKNSRPNESGLIMICRGGRLRHPAAAIYQTTYLHFPFRAFFYLVVVCIFIRSDSAVSIESLSYAATPDTNKVRCWVRYRAVISIRLDWRGALSRRRRLLCVSLRDGILSALVGVPVAFSRSDLIRSVFFSLLYSTSMDEASQRAFVHV